MRRRAVTAELRTCRVCKQRFEEGENNDKACRYHPGDWLGNENSKFFGVGPHTVGRLYERGTSYFYDCCDAVERSATGCAFTAHKTYDE